jgi:hypothetical protein
VDVDGLLEASSLIVRNEAELFHRIEVEGMNEFIVGVNSFKPFSIFIFLFPSFSCLTPGRAA